MATTQRQDNQATGKWRPPTAYAPGAQGADRYTPAIHVEGAEPAGAPDVPLPRINPATVRVKRDEVIFFANQLAVMVDTGVTLSEGLDAIADQTTTPVFKAVVTDLSEQVKGGVEFSAALQRYPRVFSELFVSLMRASEASGRMGPMLQRVCSYLNQERETLRKIRGALAYPICMMGFCAVVVVCLLLFILPRFEKIYAGKGAVLPGPTRALLGVSHVLTNYWYLVLAGLAGLIVGAVVFFRSESGREFRDTLRIRLPILGGMYRKAFLARSLRTLATMVSTGVALLEALEITAAVAGNRHFARIWNRVAQQAKEGSGLSEELANHRLVPGTVVHMIAAGERTGHLADVMDRVANFCEEDVKVAVKSVTSLIEPVMIIVMGLVIGGIAMALLLPVFSMSKLVR